MVCFHENLKIYKPCKLPQYFKQSCKLFCKSSRFVFLAFIDLTSSKYLLTRLSTIFRRLIRLVFFFLGLLALDFELFTFFVVFNDLILYFFSNIFTIIRTHTVYKLVWISLGLIRFEIWYFSSFTPLIFFGVAMTKFFQLNAQGSKAL